MLSQETLKRTPLFEEHAALSARIVPFGGWEMPVSYEGIIAEYDQTRKSVSVFDTCHMGEFLIEGDCQKSGLNRIVAHAISDMPLKTCRYGVMLNEKGGVIDDLIVYRLDKEQWMIVVNGATMEKDAHHMVSHLTKAALFKNISSKTGKLDVQGPLSRDVLKSFIPGIERLEYFGFDTFEFLGERNIVSRTGYTGELGFEVYFPWGKTRELWRKVLADKRVKPAGLGARDCLRLEMCYSLYGQELDETISPLEAGLEKFIDFNKDFIGHGALLAEKKKGVPRKIVYFTSETRQSPRHNHKIYLPNGKEIGIVTSGSFSPALQKGIGIGLIRREADITEGKILFGDEKSKIAASPSQRPFYKNGSLKS